MIINYADHETRGHVCYNDEALHVHLSDSAKAITHFINNWWYVIDEIRIN